MFSQAINLCIKAAFYFGGYIDDVLIIMRGQKFSHDTIACKNCVFFNQFDFFRQIEYSKIFMSDREHGGVNV